MEVVHETEDPSPVVCASFLESFPDACILLSSGCVLNDTVVCKLTFLSCQPTRLERTVRKEEKRANSHGDGDSTLDDE